MKLLCPTCARAFPPADVNLAEGVCFCSACQEYFKVAALLTESVAIARTAKPAHSRVELFVERDSLSFLLPAGGNRAAGIFFLCFALFWNALTWTFVTVAVVQIEVFLGLFLIPFVLVGLVTAGLALYCFKGEFTFVLDRTQCRGIWSLFRWNYTRRLATSEITAVVDDVVYTKNYRPVYGIGVRAGARTLKFGSGLTEEERLWLIGEIRHFLTPAGHPDSPPR